MASPTSDTPGAVARMERRAGVLLAVLATLALALMVAGFMLTWLRPAGPGPSLIAIGVLTVVGAPLAALLALAIGLWPSARRLAVLALVTFLIAALGAVLARAP